MIDDITINGYWNYDQITDFYIFFATALECALMGCAMTWWLWRLRTTYIRGFIATHIPVYFILSSWAFGNMYDMYYKNGDPPVTTLWQRISLFFALLLQVIFITAEARRASKKEKSYVLIVEDNEILAKIYRDILEKAEYNADMCIFGYDALTLMNYNMPHLILTDFSLGDMTGTELVRKMRAGGFTGKAVALSGRIVDCGDDFVEALLKPVTRDELLTAVKKHLA